MKSYSTNYNPPKHINRNQFNQDFITRLLNTSFTGNIDDLELLRREYNSTINVKDMNNNSIVHRLLEAPDTDIDEIKKLHVINFLFNNNVDINSVNASGITPLHIACKYQYYDIIKFLIEKGANVNYQTGQKQTPLHFYVNSNVIKCKEKKKEPLVPKSIKKSKNEIQAKLTDNILNILINNQDIKILMEHIKKTVTDLDEVFPKKFDNYYNTINSEISDKMTDISVIDKTNITDIINNKILQYSNEMNGLVNIFPLNIKMDNTGYLKILKEEDTAELISKFETKYNQNLSNINITDLSNIFGYESYELIRAIHSIIVHNEHLKLNKRNKSLAYYDADCSLDLDGYLFLEDLNDITSVEINVFENIDINIINNDLINIEYINGPLIEFRETESDKKNKSKNPNYSSERREYYLYHNTFTKGSRQSNYVNHFIKDDMIEDFKKILQFKKVITDIEGGNFNDNLIGGDEDGEDGNGDEGGDDDVEEEEEEDEEDGDDFEPDVPEDEDVVKYESEEENESEKAEEKKGESEKKGEKSEYNSIGFNRNYDQFDEYIGQDIIIKSDQKIIFITILHWICKNISELSKSVYNNMNFIKKILQKTDEDINTYDLYHRAMTSTYILLLNFLQYLILLNKILPDLTAKINTLKRDYDNIKSNALQHIYYFSYEIIIDRIDLIHNFIKTIDFKIKNAYDEISNCIKILNNLVELFNNYNGLKFIKAYFREDITNISNFFDKPFVDFHNLPDDFKRYYNSIGGDDIIINPNNIKNIIYQRYVPRVDKLNSSVYYGSNGGGEKEKEKEEEEPSSNEYNPFDKYYFNTLDDMDINQYSLLNNTEKKEKKIGYLIPILDMTEINSYIHILQYDYSIIGHDDVDIEDILNDSISHLNDKYKDIIKGLKKILVNKYVKFNNIDEYYNLLKDHKYIKDNSSYVHNLIDIYDLNNDNDNFKNQLFSFYNYDYRKAIKYLKELKSLMNDSEKVDAIIEELNKKIEEESKKKSLEKKSPEKKNEAKKGKKEVKKENELPNTDQEKTNQANTHLAELLKTLAQKNQPNKSKGGSLENYQKFTPYLEKNLKKIDNSFKSSSRIFNYIGQFEYKTDNYTINRNEKAPAIISNNIKHYLHAVCYLIIKYITRIFNKKFENEGGEEGKVDYIKLTSLDINTDYITDYFIKLYDKKNEDYITTQKNILISKTTQEILINIIKSYIYTGIANKISTNIKILDIKSLNKDVKFDINTIRENIDKIIESFDPSNNSHVLLGLELNQYDYLDLEMQQKLVSYDFFSNNPEQDNNCININIKIMDLFIKTDINYNIKDYDGKTPIYYAIYNNNISLIEKLLEQGASVYVYDRNMHSPIDYTKNKILDNLNKITNMYDNFTKIYQDNIINYIYSKSEYMNNIPKYLDIIFKQMIYMINHYFYYIMNNYPRKWNQTSKIDLYDSLIKYKILKKINIQDLTSIFENYEHNLSDTGLNKLYSLYSTEEKYTEYNGKKVTRKDINKIIEKIKKENKLFEKRNKKDLRLQQMIANNNKTIERLEGLEYKDKPTKEHLKDIIKDDIEQIKKNIQTPLEITNPTDIYKNLYNKYFENTTPLLSYDYYQLLWRKNLISDKSLNDLSKNILNMPYLVDLLLQRTLNNEPDKKNIIEYDYYHKKLTSITRFHLFIINPIIKDFYDLSQTDLDSNYLLKTIFDYINYIIQYSICSDLYLTVLRETSNYLQTYYKDPDDNSDLIKKIVEDKSLKDYIFNVLPEKLIKISLKLKTDDGDKTLEDDPKTLIENISNILKILEPSLFNPNTTLINNLRDYIYPYYTDIINIIIKNLFTLSKNYFKLLKTTGDLTYILLILYDSTKYDS
jgi:segregation and condensation protein B